MLNKIITYKFELKTESLAYFGINDQDRWGNLLDFNRNSTTEYIILGNSIGGVLRTFLEENIEELEENEIIDFMGGIKFDNKINEEYFKESKIFISDGILKSEGNDFIIKKEGTKIDGKTGTAEDGSKYEYNCIQKGSSLIFLIEFYVENSCEENNFNKIIGTLKTGFEQNIIKLGGKKSDGMGLFSLVNLTRTTIELNTIDKIKNYILFLSNNKYYEELYVCKKSDESDNLLFEFEKVTELDSYKLKKTNCINLILDGYFPYGVYQAFEVNDFKNVTVTGLQKLDEKYYIPGSTIKGIVKNDIEKLISRILNKQKLDESQFGNTDIIEEIFGSTNIASKIFFNDIIFEECKYIGEQIATDNDRNKPILSVYNKIDRFTGGAYAGAMKTQLEIAGQASIKCSIYVNEDSPYIFPIIYSLNRISEGIVWIGGRTSIGLGEFKGEKLTIEGLKNNENYTIKTDEIANENIVKSFYEKFNNYIKILDGGSTIGEKN